MASTAPKSPFTGVQGATAAMHAPYRWASVSSLSDSEYLDKMAVAIYSTTAGALGVRCADDSIHTLNFTAGQVRVGQFTQIRDNETATIVAGNLEVAYQD